MFLHIFGINIEDTEKHLFLQCMKNGLITIGEIAHNQLMPWQKDDDLTGTFQELLGYVDDVPPLNHRQFFSNLTLAFRNTGYLPDRKMEEEWNLFIRLETNDRVSALFEPILTLQKSDPKIRFYTLLTGNTAKAILLFVKNSVIQHENGLFTKYFVNKTLKRLRNMLVTNFAELSTWEDDIFIGKILHLCVAIVFLEIRVGYEEYVEKQEMGISINDIYDILVKTGLADSSLKMLAANLIHRHNSLFKTSDDLTGVSGIQGREPIPNVFLKQEDTTNSNRSKTPDGFKNVHHETGTLNRAATSEDHHNDGNQTKEEPDDKNEIIGTKEAIKLLAISKSTFMRRIKKGTIPYLKREENEHYKFRKNDILKLNSVCQ